jgi:hypothetical protein
MIDRIERIIKTDKGYLNVSLQAIQLVFVCITTFLGKRVYKEKRVYWQQEKNATWNYSWLKNIFRFYTNIASNYCE